MKKTYIKPENTVVRINPESLVAASPETPQNVTVNPLDEEVTDPGAREIISSQDVWEEW
jgi:hypothetical protein